MLSDIEIKDLIKKGYLKIEPFDEKRLGPVSYDIKTEHVDWIHANHNIAQLVSSEIYSLPRSIVGIVGLRSRAIVKDTVFASFSPLVDPGYSGKLTFLAYSPIDTTFDYENLFQIMFFRPDKPVGVAYNERKSSTAMYRTGFQCKG